MARPTAIVVYFDDGTRFHVDPAAVKSLFVNESAAKKCGHHGPHHIPQPGGPIKGPIDDPGGPPPTTAETGDTATTLAGTCYYVNGVVVCV